MDALIVTGGAGFIGCNLVDALNKRGIEDVLVVDALDNLPTRYILNKACLDMGLPLVHGAVHGFQGQAMTVIPGHGPCLMCLYGGSEHTGLIPVLGTAPGMVGCVQATEVIKILTGLGDPLLGRLLLIDGLAMRMEEIKVKRDASCLHCGKGADGAAPPPGVRESGSPDA